MIFRQLFDSVSGTYSYLLASRAGGEALILDPVLEKSTVIANCCTTRSELVKGSTPDCMPTSYRLGRTARPHPLRHHHGRQSKADVVAMRVGDGEEVMIQASASMRCTRPAIPTIPTAI